MKIGISALPFNLEEALDICCKNKKIQHIEVGIDNLEDIDILKKYKDRIQNLNLSISIHLPMELNTCENIKYIRNSWIDFICEIDKVLSVDFDVEYYNLHLGYVMTNRLDKNRQKYLKNTVEFLDNGDWKSALTGEHFFPLEGWEAGKVWKKKNGAFFDYYDKTRIMEESYNRCQTEIPEQFKQYLISKGLNVL